MAKCPCPKHPFGCYGHPYKCGCVEAEKTKDEEIAAAIERAFREGIQYATNCKVTDVDLAWETSAARKRAKGDRDG